MELSLPRVEAVGRYQMAGTLPPNLDLGQSEGAERFSADQVYLTSLISLGSNGDKIQVFSINTRSPRTLFWMPLIDSKEIRSETDLLYRSIVQVTDLELSLKLDDVHVELECLFPR